MGGVQEGDRGLENASPVVAGPEWSSFREEGALLP